jgi:hypothetical protein
MAPAAEAAAAAALPVHAADVVDAAAGECGRERGEDVADESDWEAADADGDADGEEDGECLYLPLPLPLLAASICWSLD